MNKIAVVACAYTNDPQKYGALTSTARKFGIFHLLHIFGQRRLHPGDSRVLPEAIDVLKTTTERYVICTDSYDTMFCRWDEAEIIRRIEEARGNLIVSCEAECWPPGEWCKAYARGTPWYAINGGQLCGELWAVIDLFKAMNKMPSIPNCQERMHRLYADGFELELDNFCHIFQSMSGAPSGEYVKFRDEKVRNTYTLTNPIMLHMNGRTPGLQDWHKRVMDAPY